MLATVCRAGARVVGRPQLWDALKKAEGSSDRYQKAKALEALHVLSVPEEVGGVVTAVRGRVLEGLLQKRWCPVTGPTNQF